WLCGPGVGFALIRGLPRPPAVLIHILSEPLGLLLAFSYSRPGPSGGNKGGNEAYSRLRHGVGLHNAHYREAQGTVTQFLHPTPPDFLGEILSFNAASPSLSQARPGFASPTQPRPGGVTVRVFP